MQAVKHSVIRKSAVLSDVAATEEKADLLENMKRLDLSLRFKNLTNFESICGSFIKFGLSKNEARIYVYLAKFGGQKAQNVSRALGLHRTETYKILRKLEEKGLVCRMLEKPIKFAAVQIDKALENLVQVNKLRILRLEEEKDRIMGKWSTLSVPTQDAEMPEESIQMLKGRHQINIKINEIVQNAEDEVSMAVSDETLLKIFYSSALDGAASKSGKKIRLITNSSLRSHYIIKKLKLSRDEYSFIGFTGLPGFIVTNRNLLLFLNDEGTDANSEKNGQRALWTNQKDLIKVLKASFFNFADQSAVLNATP